MLALFANNDLSECNTYLTKLFLQYCLGYFPSLDDFVFIKRVRIGHSSSDLSVANRTAEIASNMQAYALLPEYGECVEYVVIESGQSVVSGAYPVRQLYKFNKYGALPSRIYYAYYLSKHIISPVQRMTVLAGFSAEDVMLRVGTFLLHNSKVIKNYTKQQVFLQLMPYLTHLDYKQTRVRPLDIVQIQDLFAELMTDKKITDVLTRPTFLPSVQMKLSK